MGLILAVELYVLEVSGNAEGIRMQVKYLPLIKVLAVLNHHILEQKARLNA
jgi:hypothetical protein